MACLDEIKQQFPDLKDKEARRLVEELDTLKAQYRNNIGEYNKKAKKLVEEGKLSKLLELKAKVNNIVAKKRNLDHILQEGFLRDRGEGLLSLFEGTSRKVKGKFQTVEGIYNASLARFIGVLDRSLKGADFDAEFRSGQFDGEVINEYFNRSKPDYKPSKIKAVRDMADIIEKLNKYMIQTQQDVGSTIIFNPKHVIQQVHSPDKILADPNVWADFLMPRLNWMESFGTIDAEKVRAELLDMADDMESVGHHGATFMGGKRQLDFKDGFAFKEYNDAYGSGNLYEGIRRGINTAAKKTALTAIFGNNPTRQFRELKETLKDITPEESKAIEKAQNALDFFSGKGNNFKDPKSWGARAYKIGQGIKTAKVFNLLGQVGFTSMNDVVSAMMVFRTDSGDTLLKSYTDSITGALGSIKGDRVEIGEAALIHIDSQSREIFESFGSSTTEKPGIVSKLMNGYMWLNGATPVTNATRRSVMDGTMYRFTKAVQDTGSEINKFLLDQIGLKDSEIEILRGIAGEKEIDLWKLESLDIDSKVKTNIMNKVGAYFNDRVRAGSPVASAKQQRQMFRHLHKDDPVRVTAEVLGQFAGTALRTAHNFAEFIRANNSDGKLAMKNFNEVQAVGQAVFFFTITGLGIQKAKEFIQGKEKEELTMGSVMSAAVESGGAGLWADLALHGFTRPGMSRTVSPGLQIWDGLMTKARKAADGDVDFNAGSFSDTVEFIKRNTLPRNLWLQKAVENHIIKEGSYRSTR
jgi:hypothetical protein